MRYSDDLAEKTWGGVELLYEKLPKIGISYERVELKWGYQGIYRSTSFALTGVKAGQFMSLEQVRELLGGL